MIIVRPRHLRAADICMKGARAWFAAHGFNWSRFLDSGPSGGIEGETLLATNDPFAVKAVKQAQENP